MTTIQDLNTVDTPSWCPKCGNYGLMAALKMAIVAKELDPEKIAICTGIGCGSKINQWTNTYGFSSLHGRSLPVAMGVKLANHDLTVIDIGGDGDGYGIGMCHFIHMLRRNIDMTYIVQNNQDYGLTLGQVSPTSEKGMKSISTPSGVIENPVNPLRLALSSGCGFVARGYTNDLPHLSGLIEQAIAYKGFAFIDVLDPCVTFNKQNTYEFFDAKCYKLDDEEGYDSTNLEGAFARAGQWYNKIPIGVFYKEELPTYEDQDVALQDGVPRADVNISNVDVSKMVESYM